MRKIKLSLAASYLLYQYKKNNIKSNDLQILNLTKVIYKFTKKYHYNYFNDDIEYMIKNYRHILGNGSMKVLMIQEYNNEIIPIKIKIFLIEAWKAFSDYDSGMLDYFCQQMEH